MWSGRRVSRETSRTLGRAVGREGASVSSGDGAGERCAFATKAQAAAPARTGRRTRAHHRRVGKLSLQGRAGPVGLPGLPPFVGEALLPRPPPRRGRSASPTVTETDRLTRPVGQSCAIS